MSWKAWLCVATMVSMAGCFGDRTPEAAPAAEPEPDGPRILNSTGDKDLAVTFPGWLGFSAGDDQKMRNCVPMETNARIKIQRAAWTITWTPQHEEVATLRLGLDAMRAAQNRDKGDAAPPETSEIKVVEGSSPLTLEITDREWVPEDILLVWVLPPADAVRPIIEQQVAWHYEMAREEAAAPVLHEPMRCHL